MDIAIIVGLVVLLMPCFYFTIRYFLVRTSFYHITGQMEDVLENPDRNYILKKNCPDKGLETLLKAFNKYMQSSQKQRIRYDKREKEIRKQIENISHDLRTPLTSILGYIELLDRKNLSQEDAENLEVVIRKAKSLQRLITKFYDLSRLEADEYQFQNEKIDIHQMLSELMLGSYYEFENKKIEVIMEIGENPAFIMGDLDAVERILSNFIQNAIKYTKNKLYVSLRMEKNIRISFKNEAGSITEENVGQVFDRFYMKDESRTNQSSGLGLTIAKLLVEKMDGQVFAEVHDEMFEIGFTMLKLDI